ncbi:GPA3 [Symbiodinium sp. CCMP2592]|nr:GPA3 [Symbiodinium sp. CCMP2592]
MLLLAGLVGEAFASNLTWELVASGHGSTSQVAAATLERQMVIYGGQSQLWRLDLEAGAWQSIAATGSGPSGSRSYMAGSRTDGELIYFGGSNDASVFRLNASMIWAQVALTGPSPTNRYRHTAVRLSDGSLLIYAGFTFSSQPLGDVWKLIFTSEDEGFWQEVHTTGGGPGPRLGPAGLEGADGSFLTFAGHEDWGEFFDDVWRLTINGTTGVWQLVVVSGPTPGVRTFPSAVAVPGGMLIYGGFNDQIGHALKQTAYNDVWHMAINGNTGVWQNLEPAGSKPGAGSHSQAAVLCGVGLIVTIGSSTHKLNWPTGCPPGYAWQAGHCLQCPDGFESFGGCDLCQASAEPSMESVLANLSTPSLEISFWDEEVHLKLQVPQVPLAEGNLTWSLQLSASKEELQVFGPQCLSWETLQPESESSNLSTSTYQAFAPFPELLACFNSTRNSTNATDVSGVLADYDLIDNDCCLTSYHWRSYHDVVDLEACAAKCSSEPDCQNFVFDFGSCDLYWPSACEYWPPAMVCGSWGNRWYAKKAKILPGYEPLGPFTHCETFPGGWMDRQEQPCDLEECAARCSSEPDCQFFSMEALPYTCTCTSFNFTAEDCGSWSYLALAAQAYVKNATHTTTTPAPRDPNVLVRDAFLGVYLLGSEFETLAEWAIPATLQACPSGYKSVAVGCLPSLAHALPLLPSPSFQTSLQENSMLRLSFEADLPTVAENISPGFRARLGSDEGQTDCKAWNQTGQGRFVLELSVTDLDDCKLNVSTTADYVTWSGVATLALLGDFYDKPVALWIFPVTFRFDRLIHAFSSLEAAGRREVVAEEEVIHAGALNTTLTLYESDFSATKQQAVYFVWERAFVELELRSVSVVANVDLVWLAASSDASAPMVHNLTDSMIYLPASPSSRRFSVQLEVCDACFLHVLATIDSIAGRRLRERRLKVPQRLFESLPIVVKVPSSTSSTSSGPSSTSSSSLAGFSGSFELTVADPQAFVEAPQVRWSLMQALGVLWGQELEVHLAILDRPADPGTRRLAGLVAVRFHAPSASSAELEELEAQVSVQLEEPGFASDLVERMNHALEELPNASQYQIMSIQNLEAEVTLPSTSSETSEHASEPSPPSGVGLELVFGAVAACIFFFIVGMCCMHACSRHQKVQPQAPPSISVPSPAGEAKELPVPPVPADPPAALRSPCEWVGPKSEP